MSPDPGPGPAAGDPAAGDPAAGDPAAGDPAAGDPAAGAPRPARGSVLEPADAGTSSAGVPSGGGEADPIGPPPDPAAAELAEDEVAWEDRPTGVLGRLLGRRPALRLAVARAVVVAAGFLLLGLAAGLVTAAVASAKVGAGVAVLAGGLLAALGAGGGAASGLVERGLTRPLARWGALAVAPGVVVWLCSLQLIYLVGVGRAGVEGGLQGLGRWVDPRSLDAAMALCLSLGGGLGVGLTLSRVVDRRLAGDAPWAQVRAGLRTALLGVLGAGCGGGCLLMLLMLVLLAVAALLGREEDPGKSPVGVGATGLWMSAIASLLTVGVATALVGPWLLRAADRLDARLAGGAGARRRNAPLD